MSQVHNIIYIAIKCFLGTNVLVLCFHSRYTRWKHRHMLKMIVKIGANFEMLFLMHSYVMPSAPSYFWGGSFLRQTMDFINHKWFNIRQPFRGWCENFALSWWIHFNVFNHFPAPLCLMSFCGFNVYSSSTLYDSGVILYIIDRTTLILLDSV